MNLGEWYEREYNSPWSVDVLNDPQVMRKWAAYLEFQSVSADFVDIKQLQKLWERVDQAAAKCKESKNDA